MAKDELILHLYTETKIPVLRVYRWSSPFVSLGFFQNAYSALNLDACQRYSVGVVRRLTGGASIFHSSEITYSLACGREDLGLPQNVKESFRVLNKFLIDFYARLGLKAEFSLSSEDNIYRHNNFCFASRQRFDILVDGKKIGGNAQRRKKTIIFQHGSIPQEIDYSIVKEIIQDNLEGVEEYTTCLDMLLGRRTTYEELIPVFLRSFSACFGINFINYVFNREWEEKLLRLVNDKYATYNWNFKDEKASMVK